MSTGKLLLIGGGLAAATLLIMSQSGEKLSQLDVSLTDIGLDVAKTNANQTTLKLSINVYNPNDTPVEFKSFTGNIIYKGANIANIDPLTKASRLFPARQNSLLPISVAIPNARMASSFLTMLAQFITKDKQILVDFKGELKAEKMTIPVVQQINLSKYVL